MGTSDDQISSHTNDILPPLTKNIAGGTNAINIQTTTSVMGGNGAGSGANTTTG